MRQNWNPKIAAIVIACLGIFAIIGAYRLEKMRGEDQSYEVEASASLNIDTQRLQPNVPNPQTGQIRGKVCYPKESNEEGIIAAKNIKSGIIYTRKFTAYQKAKESPYTMELIPGKYKLRFETFSQDNQFKPYSGYYNKEETIEVEVGKTISNIDLCIFYPSSLNEPGF